MVNIIKISRVPGVWEHVAECWLCEGSGNVSGDVYVIDHECGGHITEAVADCPDCDGRGYNDLTDEQLEAAVFSGEIKVQ